MLAIEPLRPGSTFHWAIEDILRHRSTDFASVEDDGYRICINCGEGAYLQWESWGFECLEGFEHEERDPTLPELWEQLLNQKRGDDHYQDLSDEIKANGFTKRPPCWAGGWKNPDDSLIYGDGNHRLAVAIDLGMTIIPMQVTSGFWVEEDSGVWNSSDDEDW